MYVYSCTYVCMFKFKLSLNYMAMCIDPSSLSCRVCAGSSIKANMTARSSSRHCAIYTRLNSPQLHSHAAAAENARITSPNILGKLFGKYVRRAAAPTVL